MNDPMQGVFHGFDIVASGLRAEQQRAEIVSANLGNMSRTGNKHREPYRRRSVVFEEVLDSLPGLRGVSGGDRTAAGVKVAQVVEDQVSPFPKHHNPGHPDADEDGWVWGSNVDLFQELVDLAAIERSFDANLAAMRAYRNMLQNTLANMRAS
jgi:flagellar basal-body rod protein FlgC